MPERARANRVVAQLFVAQIVVVVVLIVAVMALEANTRSSQQAARERQTEQLRQSCQREVQRDFEAYGVNQDLMTFANDAAAARRAAGQPGVARKYAETADRASARMVKIGERLPRSDDPATIATFCRVLFPALR